MFGVVNLNMDCTFPHTVFSTSAFSTSLSSRAFVDVVVLEPLAVESLAFVRGMVECWMLRFVGICYFLRLIDKRLVRVAYSAFW